MNAAAPGSDIILFGNGRFASLYWYMLNQDSPYRVVAFTVDAAYCNVATLQGLPVVPFEAVQEHYPPAEFGLCVALGYVGLNALRIERMAQARDKGYELVSYVSSRAILSPAARLGNDCMIHEGAIVEPYATLGDNCILRPGCVIRAHAEVEAHCFIASRAVVAGSARVGERCMLGLNSSVAEGVRLAPRCLVGAGAAVLADTEADGVYLGVPARRLAGPAKTSK